MEEQPADIVASSCACVSLPLDSFELKQAASMTTDDYINDEGTIGQTEVVLTVYDRNNETEFASTADFKQATARAAINYNDGMELGQTEDGIQDENADRKNVDNDDSDASTIIEEYCDLFLGQNDINNTPSHLDYLSNTQTTELDICHDDVVQVRSSGSSSTNILSKSFHQLDSINTAENIKSSKPMKRPCGRPRKIPTKSHVDGSHNAGSLQKCDNFSIKPDTTGNRDRIGRFEAVVEEEQDFQIPLKNLKFQKETVRRGQGRPRGRPRSQPRIQGRDLNSGTGYNRTLTDRSRNEFDTGSSFQGQLPVKDKTNHSGPKSRSSDSVERGRGSRGRGRPRRRRGEWQGRGQETDRDCQDTICRSRRTETNEAMDSIGNHLNEDQKESSTSKALRSGVRSGLSPDLKTFPCTHCLKPFRTQMSLNQHLKWVHNAVQPLAQPSMWFFQRQCHAVADAVATLAGAQKNSPAKPSDDKDCDELSAGELKEKSLNSRLQIRCQVCDQVFGTYYLLLVHSRSHTGQGLQQCKICDQQFVTRGHLVQHHKTHDLSAFEEKSSSDTHSVEMDKDACDKNRENACEAFPGFSLSDLNLEGAEAISIGASLNNGDLSQNDVIVAGEKINIEDEMMDIEKQIALTEYADVQRGVRYKAVHKMLYGRPASKTKKSVECPVCGKAFTTKYSLVIHGRIHSGEKPYACDVCSLRFYTKGHLVSHQRTHTGEKPYRCKDCGRSFSASNPLRRHELSFHSTLRPYVCEFCAFTFKFKDHLRLHILRRHSAKKQFQCKFCDMMFTDRKLAARHERSKHRPTSDGFEETSERRFKCRLCGLSFESTLRVKQHKASAHSAEVDRNPAQLHRCPVCDKSYSWRAGLRAHLAVHSGERRFECTVCNKKFFHHNILRRHSVTHSEARPFSCGVCGRRFKSKGVMVKHEARSHFGEKQFSCELCGSQFFTATELKTHKSFVHTDEKSFVCEICDAHLKTQMSLKQHLLCHGEKKFACEICGKQFYTQQNMRRHHRLHSNDEDVRKPFNCHLCGKQFRTKKYLVRHMGTHDEKKYSGETFPKRSFDETEKEPHEAVHEGRRCCRFCGHVYASAEELELHERIHVGNRPFECAVCDERFACKKSLRRHMTLHTGDKRHECQSCGKRFREECYLTKHLLSDCTSMPYACCLCNRRYVWRHELMLHYRNCKALGAVDAEMAIVSENTDIEHVVNEASITEFKILANFNESYSSL